jgi:protein-tyrosine phosphatase
MLNARIALRYAVGATATAAAAWWIGGYGWLLLWLAISLAAQALAYAGAGAVVFRKRNGRLPWDVRILLAPYMIAARITLHYYCRGLAPYAEAAPGVWIGRRLTNAEAAAAIQKGVTAALDLTAGFPECAPLLALPYLNVQLLPITVPTHGQLRESVAFIQQHSARGIVYVHGALGYSRSVGVVSAYLVAAGLAKTAAEAVERVRAVVPQTLLDDVWMRRLGEFEAGLLRPITARR